MFALHAVRNSQSHRIGEAQNSLNITNGVTFKTEIFGEINNFVGSLTAVSFGQ